MTDLIKHPNDIPAKRTYRRITLVYEPREITPTQEINTYVLRLEGGAPSNKPDLDLPFATRQQPLEVLVILQALIGHFEIEPTESQRQLRRHLGTIQLIAGVPGAGSTWKVTVIDPRL